MADIKFETGLKTFTINDACEVTFAPTDLTFIEKVFTALDNMDKKQEGYRELADKAENKEMFALARRMNDEAREEINAIFGIDVCSPVFGSLNVFTIADGFPVWANFILAIVDELDGSFAAEKKKTNPRIAKYTAKYKR